MKKNRTQSKKILTGGALVLAATAPVLAQQKPFMLGGTAQPPLPKPVAAKPASVTSTNAVGNFFNGKLPDALAKGKLNLNVRLRYEQVDQSSLADDSFAPTIRTRLGYTTAPLYGFQAMAEGVNIAVIGPERNYNAAGSNHQPTRPVVADPPMTKLDQAWVGYTYTNWVAAKVGEQQINLDNQRFVGDVGWRQNMQTYDAATIGSSPIKDLNLYYGYLWDVHRVFGNVSGLPAANQDFDSRSHLINISYSGWKYGRFVGYTYLLDLHNAVAGDPNSCATYGGYFTGQAKVTDKVSVDYRAEFAWQTDYADSTLRYGTEYYNLEGGMSVRPFAFGAGYEDLGSSANTGAGGGRASFRTPLATLHAFNGWDDVFLTTPANGLQDLYAYAQITLPWQIPVRFVFHKFDADYGTGDYGQEYDVVVSKKFGKYWTALLKYAYYDGQDAAAPSLATARTDIQKFWVQVEFNF